MSTPANTATQTETPNSAGSEDLTPEQRAEMAEKRHRDTQSAYTKGQQKLKQAEAEAEALREMVTKNVVINLPEEQQTELDELKYSDPVAWREKLNTYEDAAKSEALGQLEEATAKARETAGAQNELERRQQVLTEFNESAKVTITDELIANDVPPRITNKLANGDITFEEFLTEVDEYVNTGKVIKDEETLGQPNLNKAAGGSTPGNAKAEESLSGSYAKDVY